MNLKRLARLAMTHVIAAMIFALSFFLEVYEIHLHLLSIKV